MNRSSDAISWDLLASFLAVMRTGSLSGASRALGVAQPTVRRQVEALEEALGVALFTRSQAGLAPTDAATATLPYAESMAGSADALVRAVHAGKSEAAGTVRITSSEVIGLEVLPPMLRDLRAAHPKLSIELSATNVSEDLVRRDADVAVRVAPPTQSALVSKRVGSIGVGMFASRRYLDEHSTPRNVADLAKHALIGRDRDTSFYAAMASVGVSLRRSDFAFRTDSDVAQLAAVRAGIGIGICQIGLAGDLVRVVPKLHFALPTYVVTHEDLRQTRRVSVVFEHLCDAFAAYCD